MIRDEDRQIGPYQLHEELERNTITTLYRATDQRTTEQVIFHQLHPSLAQDSTVVEQFLAAGKELQTLSHSVIVPVLDSGVIDRNLSATEFDNPSPEEPDDPSAQSVQARYRQGPAVYIVTAAHSMQTLVQFLQQRTKRLELHTVFQILKSLTSALTVAHKQGLTHGALSPTTIYVSQQEDALEPVILLDRFYTVPLPLDLHVSQVGDENSAESVKVDRPAAAEQQQSSDLEDDSRAVPHQPLAVAQGQDSTDGLPASAIVSRWPVSSYMAPEQARNEAVIDPRTDVYSLGAVAYLLLLGRPPFAPSPPAMLLAQIVDRTPQAPDIVDPAVSPGIAYVLKSVLAKDAGTRYANVNEFITALEQGSRWVAAPPIVEPARPFSPATRVQKQTRRRRGRIGIVVAALMALLVITGALLFRSDAMRTAIFTRLANAGFSLDPGMAQGDIATPTVDPADLIPILMLTVTPSPATPTPTGIIRITSAATPGVRSTPTMSLETTALTEIAAAINFTATAMSMAETAATTATITVPVSSRTSAVASITPTETNDEYPLTIDPFNLLTGNVAPGDIVINGQAPANQRLLLFVNGRQTDSIVTKNSGTWSIIRPLKEIGTYDIAVQLLDESGTIVATDARTITIAGQMPTARSGIGGSMSESSRGVTTTMTVTSVMASVTTPSRTPASVPTSLSNRSSTATAIAMTKTVAPAIATKRPTPTNLSLPLTSTVTPLPTVAATVTNTPRPTATVTNTPLPTATATPNPTATATMTNTPLPTATDTPLPTNTATDTPLPTNTATAIPVPTNTVPPTNTPLPTATNTPIPTPTVAVGQITPSEPPDGSSGGGQRVFRWQANFTPAAGTGFELIFWRPEENPIANGFGLASPTTNTDITVDLDLLDDVLGSRLDNGNYLWGVLLVRTDPYERIAYLGGGYEYNFTRSSGGSNNGGPSSGE